MSTIDNRLWPRNKVELGRSGMRVSFVSHQSPVGGPVDTVDGTNGSAAEGRGKDPGSRSSRWRVPA